MNIDGLAKVRPPTRAEWALFEALPWPAHLYKHSCPAGGYTVMGRQHLGDGSWIDHKHYAPTAGEAIRKAAAATGERRERTCARRAS